MNLTSLKFALSRITDEEVDKFQSIIERYNKIIILGNGGSNAIAQHIAQDYTKVLHKKALCFADASRLTCYINDYSMDQAYAHFLDDFADKETLVILISSSGESRNILESAFYCKDEGIPMIILSGFKKDNVLRRQYSKYAELSLWVDSETYGVVELTHEAFLHSVC